MPVSRQTAEGLAGDVSAVYARAEVRLLRLIGQHLATGHGAPSWAEAKLAELQVFRRRADKIMHAATAEAQAASGEAVRTAYLRGAAVGQSELDNLGRDTKAPRLAEFAVEALVRAHTGTLLALGPQIVRHTVDAYRAAVVKASAGTITGAATRVQDAQVALDDLARQGITGFVDAKGRRWGLQSYVDMATRTVTAQAAVQGHMDRLEQGGLSLFIVSNSSRECELCRRWEGKVLSRGPVDAMATNVLTGKVEHVRVDGTVEEATRAGLFHPNCTHNLSGYVHGATKRGDATHDPKGYADKQRLRAMERNVRAWKRREAAAITPEAKRTASGKVRQWQAAIRDHTEATGLPRKPARESFDVKPPATPGDLARLGDLSGVDQDVLDQAMSDLMERGDFGPRFAQIAEELDRRDNEAARDRQTVPATPDPVAEQEALNRLLFGDSETRDLTSSSGVKRRDPEKVLRDEYDTWVHTQWLRAEEQTRGNLLSRAGQQALERGDFTTLDLFTRKRRSLEYASEELQRWFAESGNQRLSFPEFRAGRMDDKRAREAAQRLRNRGYESEHG